MMDQLETGDVLLFSNKKFWFSRLIEFMTESEWSHVGIVLRDPTYIDPKLTGLYLWESGTETLLDAEDHVNKWGVQLVDLEKKIESYDGTIFYRKLGNVVNTHFKSRSRTKDMEDKIKIIYNTMLDKPYDANPLDLLFCWLGIESKYVNERILDKIFCSAFVGYVYAMLGYLDKNINWTMIEPKYFSEKYSPTITCQESVIFQKEDDKNDQNGWNPISHGHLPFINGYTLDQEVQLK